MKSGSCVEMLAATLNLEHRVIQGFISQTANANAANCIRPALISVLIPASSVGKACHTPTAHATMLSPVCRALGFVTSCFFLTLSLGTCGFAPVSSQPC